MSNIEYHFESLAELALHLDTRATQALAASQVAFTTTNEQKFSVEATTLSAIADMLRKTVIEPPPKEENVNKYLAPWRVERQGNGTLNETIIVRSATGWAICVMRENTPQAATVARAIAALEFSFSDDEHVPSRPKPPIAYEGGWWDDDPSKALEELKAKAAIISKLCDAIEHVRAIVAKGAPVGFNPNEGGKWAEELFASQAVTFEALVAAGRTGRSIA